MKLLVIGLDCAAPDVLFNDEALTNFRRLMDAGCWGRLESVIPPITVPAWMCMSTSQDPGSLGVYGFHNRNDRSYSETSLVNSRSIQELAIWDQIAREGGRSVIIGVPPGYPPRKINGISVGCFLTPDPAQDTYTHPASAKQKIAALVGDYPVDVKGFRTTQKDWLREEIRSMTRKHFAVVRHFLQEADWDLFCFVEIGLDRVQHGFWEFHDPEHRKYQAGNPYENVIRDYYRSLDEEVGRILDLLEDDTAVLVVSDHGAQRLDAGFCVNEWLVREGILVLHEYPRQVTPFRKLSIDWTRSKAWSEGGYCARVFLNVKGREPSGTIEPSEYEKFRDDLTVRLEATTDENCHPLGTVVFKPDQIYHQTNNVPPDLIVYFGNLFRRSIGGVGYPTLHVQENDTGPDGCNHAQFGSFILAGSTVPSHGMVEGTHLLDIAPTLLELGGYDVPRSMQGKSLNKRISKRISGESAVPDRGEAIIRERLSGLGYIS
jgi:predicted AlkP superfamily phosphohydrolase/phosphomutase